MLRLIVNRILFMIPAGLLLLTFLFALSISFRAIRRTCSPATTRRSKSSKASRRNTVSTSPSMSST
jgi:hypothetical protein